MISRPAMRAAVLCSGIALGLAGMGALLIEAPARADGASIADAVPLKEMDGRRRSGEMRFHIVEYRACFRNRQTEPRRGCMAVAGFSL